MPSKTQHGSITVRAGRCHIDAEEAADTYGAVLTPGEHVFVDVEDDGPGIQDETRDRIFEPFFTTKFSGRGLGLAAVLGIVKVHRGAIQLDTEPGRGTRRSGRSSGAKPMMTRSVRIRSIGPSLQLDRECGSQLAPLPSPRPVGSASASMPVCRRPI